MRDIVAIEYAENVKYPSGIERVYPNKDYPEITINHDKINKENTIFEMVRNGFKLLELDKKNINTANWNPLGEYIKTGQKVLIKPNMVLDRNLGGFGEECLYTNPSIVSAVINYVWKALKENGEIIVADAPVQDCDFEKLIETSGYKNMIEYYKNKGVNISLLDLRGLKSKHKNGTIIQEISNTEGILVNLDEKSEHARLNNDELKNIRITKYDPDELLKHHNENKHEYLIAKEVLEADVIINMPKPKAHRKAGVTGALKNFVGANVRKEYLPHHRLGDKNHNGDEYGKASILLIASSKLLDISNKFMKNKKHTCSKITKGISKILSGFDKRFISKEKNREGSWYGNDTIWRTIIDINKIIKYADKKGVIQDSIQRKVFNVGDMIIVGEKEGPMLPSPKYGGIIAMSEDIVLFDENIVTIMGFDINKIPTLKNVRNDKKYKLTDSLTHGKIISNDDKWNNKGLSEIEKKNTLCIEPSSGWKGHIELE